MSNDHEGKWKMDANLNSINNINKNKTGAATNGRHNQP
jgi:hypothetical protein